MEREFRKRLEREWRVIFSSNESIQRYFNEGKLFSRDARSRRERERDREINLGAIEIKILLNCCSFGRNMVETFVGDEKKKLSLSFERKIFKQNFLLIITLYPRESNMLIAQLSNAYLIFKNDRGGGR